MRTNTKRLLAFLLVVWMLTLPTVALNGNSYEANDPKYNIMNNDHAPAIGEFKLDPNMQEYINEKEEWAKNQYIAKLGGNKQLAEKRLARLFATGHDLELRDQQPGDDGMFNYEWRLNIYQVPQDRDYYCGYAAIKSILNYHGIYKSQKQIAKEVYREDKDCPWYLSNGNSYSQFPVPKYLKAKTGFNYAPAPYGAAGTNPLSVGQVKYRVATTLHSYHGVLACGRSAASGISHLPGYPRKPIGHWIVVDGYKDYCNRIWYIDPAKSPVISWSHNIEKYQNISVEKFTAFIRARGIVW